MSTPQLDTPGTYPGRVFWTGVKQDKNGNPRFRCGFEVETEEGARVVWGGWPLNSKSWRTMLERAFGDDFDPEDWQTTKDARVIVEAGDNGDWGIQANRIRREAAPATAPTSSASNTPSSKPWNGPSEQQGGGDLPF